MNITYITITAALRAKINPFLASILFSNILGIILNKYCHEQITTKYKMIVINVLVTILAILFPSWIPPRIDE